MITFRARIENVTQGILRNVESSLPRGRRGRHPWKIMIRKKAMTRIMSNHIG